MRILGPDLLPARDSLAPDLFANAAAYSAADRAEGEPEWATFKENEDHRLRSGAPKSLHCDRVIPKNSE
jgi:hypothetical protein